MVSLDHSRTRLVYGRRVVQVRLRELARDDVCHLHLHAAMRGETARQSPTTRMAHLSRVVVGDGAVDVMRHVRRADLVVQVIEDRSVRAIDGEEGAAHVRELVVSKMRNVHTAGENTSGRAR